MSAEPEGGAWLNAAVAHLAACCSRAAADDWEWVWDGANAVPAASRNQVALLTQQHLLAHDREVAIASCHVLTILALAPGAPPPIECPLRSSGDAGARIRWLREHLRPYAGDLAVWVLCGEGSALDAEADVLLAGCGTAQALGWPRLDGWAAGRQAWSAAQARAVGFMDQLRRRLWALARGGEPGAGLLAAADAVDAAHGGVLPTRLLHDAVLRIAHGAVKRGRPRGR